MCRLRCSAHNHLVIFSVINVHHLHSAHQSFFSLFPGWGWGRSLLKNHEYSRLFGMLNNSNFTSGKTKPNYDKRTFLTKQKSVYEKAITENECGSFNAQLHF